MPLDFDSRSFTFARGASPIAIAEAGVNHNGRIDLARQLVLRAKTAGAHIVKFQAFVAEEEISRFAEKAEYQKETTGGQGGQLEMAKALELGPSDLRTLRDFCREQGMPFLCSAFESLSLRILTKDLGLRSIKVASSEVTNHPFLAEIGSTGAGVLLSTGASTLDEVAAAVKVLRSSGGREIVLLHCLSNYPADVAQVNLAAMETLGRAFDLPVGYSDHTPGIEIAMLATALGAVCVEKHLTLDRSMSGPDHRASLEPEEFARMVRGMASAHAALGDGVKRPAPSEMAIRALIRKSLVARRDLPAGHVLAASDIAAKRPLGGIEPFDLDKVLGRRLKRAVQQDEPFTWDLLA